MGGYYQFHFGYVDAGGTDAAGEDVGGFDMFSDAEIHFSPSITLDNGLTVGARVELEGQQSDGGQIDHTFMTLSSDTFGTLQAGNLNGVGYNTSFVTPGVGSVGIDSGTMSQFIPLLEVERTIGGDTLDLGLFPNAHHDLSGDNLKINYITPSFNGFTLGLEYTPSTKEGNSRNPGVIDRNEVGNFYDVWGVAANYAQSYGTTDVTLHARYQTGSLETGVGVQNVEPEIFGLGVAVGFSGVTIGGNYESFESDLANNFADVETWTLGVSYDMAGPWTIGADMVQADYDGGTTADAEEFAVRLGAARDLAPGVAWDVNFIMYEGDDKVNAGTERDGNILVSTLSFKF